MNSAGPLIRAPTVTDAERAAFALADAGAGLVVLFGSVARGDAIQGSDIDLIAVYDDIDYQTRERRTRELTIRVEEAVEWPVDLYLTDRPEWKVRTERMRTSFEHRALREGIVLADLASNDNDVDWAKKMVMPSSDHDEAVRRLGDVNSALAALTGCLGPNWYEGTLREQNLEMEVFFEYTARLGLGCEKGHLAIEYSLKSLMHLASAPPGRAWGHDLEELWGQLVEPHASEVAVRIEAVGFDNLRGWSVKARYQDAARGTAAEATSELFCSITEAACSIAGYTASLFDPSIPHIANIFRRIPVIEHYLWTYDPTTGAPLHKPS